MRCILLLFGRCARIPSLSRHPIFLLPRDLSSTSIVATRAKKMSPSSKKHARSESANGNSHKEQEDPALQRPSVKRAKEIDADSPYSQLQEALSEQQKSDPKPRNVLHWFRSKDLRIEDNKALHAASQKAGSGDGSLVTLYIYSPKDFEWHGTSPARLDLILQTLGMMKEQLKAKNIPLAIMELDERKGKAERVLEFAQQHGISHVFANFEYEVDELRRDFDLATLLNGKKGKDEQIALELFHDQTVVEPGTLTSGSGGPMQVFTPYHKAWLAQTRREPELFDTVPAPEGNSKDATKEFKELFESKIPDMPSGKDFESSKERDRLRKLWPAGHDAAMQRLKSFLNKKVSEYAAHRSEPAADVASRLSPYFSSGIISVREVLQETKKFNQDAHFDDGDRGVYSWVREIVFREFYRQTLVLKPHGSMNLPQNLKFDFVEWEDDEEGWKRWCEGQTGVPWVDAGMRQLNTEAYMHNRLRMQTASYLRANLLIDYRRGERYFVEHLVDWDLANNTNGWEPSYTIFNPISQAEKCDKEGEYIRKWVPELKDVEGKAVFAPYDRLSKEEFEKLGYPKPCVDYAESARRAKERYKRDLHSGEL